MRLKRGEDLVGADAASLSRRDLAHASLALAIGAHGSAVLAADAPDADVELGPGEHAVERDWVIRGTLVLRPGARLRLARGATVTVLGDVLAPATLLFTGEGRVDLTRSRLLAARPEWWGAAPNDPAVDCAPAIEAALAAHLAVELGLGDYHLRRTLVIDRPNRRLSGIGRSKGAGGTRLLLASADGAVVRVGFDSAPAIVNDYLWGVDLRRVELGRIVAPGSQATGLQVRYVVDCVFEGLRANEHAIGFSLRGAVRTLVNDCGAFRSQFGDAPGASFVGFDLDGTNPPIPTGANASLYLVDCVANAARPQSAEAIGCRISGAFSDTFLVRFETNQLSVGLIVDGARQRGRYAQLDLHVDTPVLDQCAQSGITIRNLDAAAMIDIASPWIAVPATAEAALQIESTGGAISIVGGQIVATGGGSTVGLLMRQVQGITLVGTKMLDTIRPVVAQSATGFDLSIVVLPGATAGDIALRLANCAQGAVRARLLGAPGRFATGVAMDAACREMLVETIGLGAATVPVRIGTSIARATAGVVVLSSPRPNNVISGEK